MNDLYFIAAIYADDTAYIVNIINDIVYNFNTIYNIQENEKYFFLQNKKNSIKKINEYKGYNAKSIWTYYLVKYEERHSFIKEIETLMEII